MGENSPIVITLVLTFTVAVPWLNAKPEDLWPDGIYPTRDRKDHRSKPIEFYLLCNVEAKRGRMFVFNKFWNVCFLDCFLLLWQFSIKKSVWTTRKIPGFSNLKRETNASSFLLFTCRLKYS
jgi:hypothetical protein